MPTVTTSLTGFGHWVNTNYKEPHPGIKIVFRNDNNHASVVNDVAAVIRRMSMLSAEEALRMKAGECLPGINNCLVGEPIEVLQKSL